MINQEQHRCLWKFSNRASRCSLQRITTLQTAACINVMNCLQFDCYENYLLRISRVCYHILFQDYVWNTVINVRERKTNVIIRSGLRARVFVILLLVLHLSSVNAE